MADKKKKKVDLGRWGMTTNPDLWGRLRYYESEHAWVWDPGEESGDPYGHGVEALQTPVQTPVLDEEGDEVEDAPLIQLNWKPDDLSRGTIINLAVVTPARPDFLEDRCSIALAICRQMGECRKKGWKFRCLMVTTASEYTYEMGYYRSAFAWVGSHMAKESGLPESVDPQEYIEWAICYDGWVEIPACDKNRPENSYVIDSSLRSADDTYFLIEWMDPWPDAWVNADEVGHD